MLLYQTRQNIYPFLTSGTSVVSWRASSFLVATTMEAARSLCAGSMMFSTTTLSTSAFFSSRGFGLARYDARPTGSVSGIENSMRSFEMLTCPRPLSHMDWNSRNVFVNGSRQAW